MSPGGTAGEGFCCSITERKLVSWVDECEVRVKEWFELMFDKKKKKGKKRERHTHIHTHTHTHTHAHTHTHTHTAYAMFSLISCFIDIDRASPGKLFATGLPNLGSTCYINATLQCLLACPQIVNAILRPDIPRRLFFGISNIFMGMLTGSVKTQHAQAALKEMVRASRGILGEGQQCCVEFLEKMFTADKDSAERDRALISRFLILDERECQRCKIM